MVDNGCLLVEFRVRVGGAMMRGGEGEEFGGGGRISVVWEKRKEEKNTRGCGSARGCKRTRMIFCWKVRKLPSWCASREGDEADAQTKSSRVPGQPRGAGKNRKGRQSCSVGNMRGPVKK